MLCPFHHRALHTGEFSIDGDPEAGTLRFLDPWGQPITAPDLTSARDPAPADDPPDGRPPDPGGEPPPPTFTPPYGERLTADTFSWN